MFATVGAKDCQKECQHGIFFILYSEQIHTSLSRLQIVKAPNTSSTL